MTHYETLGVPRDASAAEIKAAWRRASSAAHPDREGGSTEAQAAVNKAYEVLCDDGRRAAYDATGSDQQAPALETEAQQLLAQLFGQVLGGTSGDPITSARQVLLQARLQLGAHRDEAQDKRDRLAAMRDKIAVKGDAPNLAHGIIDSQLASFDNAFALMDRGDKVHELVGAMLDAYEFTGAPPAVSSAFMTGFDRAFYDPRQGWR